MNINLDTPSMIVMNLSMYLYTCIPCEYLQPFMSVLVLTFPELWTMWVLAFLAHEALHHAKARLAPVTSEVNGELPTATVATNFRWCLPIRDCNRAAPEAERRGTRPPKSWTYLYCWSSINHSATCMNPIPTMNNHHAWSLFIIPPAQKENVFWWLGYPIHDDLRRRRYLFDRKRWFYHWYKDGLFCRWLISEPCLSPRPPWLIPRYQSPLTTTNPNELWLANITSYQKSPLHQYEPLSWTIKPGSLTIVMKHYRPITTITDHCQPLCSTRFPPVLSQLHVND